MSHTKTTTRLNVQISHAEAALDTIVNLASWNPELNECVNTIQLVLKVCEHKLLRLEELQTEVAKLRARASVADIQKNTDLVTHCAELQAELEAANRRIAELEGNGESEDLQETGTA